MAAADFRLMTEATGTAIKNAILGLPNATQAAADNANAAAADARTAIAQLGGLVAETYSSSSKYKVGDYAYYNGNLYRCTTAITTAEAWDADNWILVALGTDVAKLKRALDIASKEKMVITVPPGVTETYDVSFVLPYNNYRIYVESNTAYIDGQPLTMFSESWVEKKLWGNTKYDMEWPPNIVRIHYDRLKQENNTVVGGTIIIRFTPEGKVQDDLVLDGKFETIDDTFTTISNVFNNGYHYKDFEIPAGTTGDKTFDFSEAGILPFDGTSFYFQANTAVYNGEIKIFDKNYADQVSMWTAGRIYSMTNPPKRIRFYYENMVKSGGTVVGGTMRVYFKQNVSLTNPKIDGRTFSEWINEGDAVPDYYKAHAETQMKAIRENMMEVGKQGETFIFITDTHWESNEKHSPSLVKYLLNNLNINVFLNGGDLINQGLWEPMAENMRKAITSFAHRDIRMLCAFGNHDGNWNDYGGQREHPERRFLSAQQYALMQKQQEDVVTYFASWLWNFYYDRKETKTRFIVLDSGEYGLIDDQIFSDLMNLLLTTPENYHVVIMCHWLYDGGAKTASCTTLESLIDAFNSKGTMTIGSATVDFAEANGTISLLLGGHLHNDLAWATTGGVPVALTDCDAGNRSENTDYPFVAGTITEQAFDVVTINYETGSVKAVRVGRGANRTFAGGSWS